MNPVCYLSFDGQAREAMNFYAQVLGGNLTSMLAYSKSPCAAQMPDVDPEAIMHACLELPGGGSLMAGDCAGGCSGGPFQGIKGMTVTLNYATVEEATSRFRALAEGGQVQMDLQPSFWAKVWGMCLDKFGTPWIVNGELVPVGQEVAA